MDALTFSSFAFLSGLTLAGLAGALMELAWGRTASLGEPFVSREHVLRSLCLTAMAGPVMLSNEAIHAWRSRLISAPVLAACVAGACMWALAAGVLILDLAFSAGDLLLLHLRD